MPYMRPLLATDLSDAARPAARLLPLLCALEARGRAVTVLPHPDMPTRLPRDAREDVRAAIEARRVDAENVLREWLRAEKLSSYEAQVRYGSIVRMLTREAETADIVAVGATGTSRLERIMLGSVARGILRRVGCDTLVARDGQGPRPIQSILLATDFQASSRAAAEVASSIAAMTGAHTQLLHTIDPSVAAGILYPGEMAGYDTSTVQKYAVDEIHRLNLERFEGSADERVVHGRAAQAIVAAGKDARADLLIVGSHGEGIASRVLLGSVAEAVVERAHCSVLLVRPRRRAAPSFTDGSP